MFFYYSYFWFSNSFKKQIKQIKTTKIVYYNIVYNYILTIIEILLNINFFLS